MESVDESRDVMLINGILQGIATGVFIYVTFFEILNDKVNSKTSFRNILAIFFGFVVMAAIAGITPSAAPGSDDYGSLALTGQIVTAGNTNNSIDRSMFTDILTEHQLLQMLCNCSNTIF